MKVFAPGKLVLTGPYAVLEGAPALVCATSRGVVADGSAPPAEPTIEVAAAKIVPPRVDASALFENGRKLGLGASAAILVASLGLRAAERGEDLQDPAVRARLFEAGRAAHAAAQAGGSGVDVAASVHGGALLYTLEDGGRAAIEPVALPRDLTVSVLAARTSARTSELRGRVDALRARDAAAFARAMGPLADAARAGAAAVRAGDARALIAAGQATARALEGLGAAAGAPIVPPAFAELGRMAAAEDAAFFGAGAGGGDVAVFLGLFPPSRTWLVRATQLELDWLDISLESGTLKGVQTLNGP